MKINSCCLMVMTILFFHTSFGFNTFSQPPSKTYDASSYKIKLEDIQSQYRDEAERLNQKLQEINAIIADKQITSKQKIIKLSQSMADQQEIIYSIQKTHQIPYEVKQCQCIQISDADKQRMLDKVNQLNQSIEEMETSIGTCQGESCSKTHEINTSTSNMKLYLQALKSIVDSDCCNKPLYMAPEQAVGLVDLNHTLKLDNLDLVESYDGLPKLFRNKYYAQITSKKQYRPFRFELTSKYNTSKCPLDKPFSNFKNNTCFRCDLTCLKFDLINRTCYQCDQKYLISCKEEEGEYYNEISNACETCPKNHEYNHESLKCEKCGANQYVGKNHLCQSCPYGQYYNSKSSECDYCPGRRYFSVEQGECVRCPENTELNFTNLKCQPCRQKEHYNSTIGICTVCQDGSVFIPETNSCFHKVTSKSCPADSPFYNVHTRKCEQCSRGQIYSKALNRCIRNNNIGICHPQKPLYNYKSHACEACPQNTEYNEYFYECDPIE